jgi:hypothetical protein
MMRRINLLGIGMPALALCALAACGSDDSEKPESQGDAASDSGTTHDAGTDVATTAPDAEGDSMAPEDAGIDATLSVLDGSTPDGSASDGSTPVGDRDAGHDAADAGEAGTVQIVVLSTGAPEQGVTVVFSDATGAFIAMAVTDAQGSVVQAIAAGTQVTALLSTRDAPNLVTVTGVKPGDVLKFHDGSFPGLGGTAAVTFAKFAQADASVSDYTLTSGVCAGDTGGPAGTFDYFMSGTCMNAEGQFPVLAEAIGSAGPVAWESGKGTLNADPKGVSTVDLGAATWSTTYGTETATLLDVPATANPWMTVFEYAASDSVTAVGYFSPGTTSTSFDGGVASTFPIHPGFGDFNQVEVDVPIVDANGLSTYVIADRVGATTPAVPSASDTIDLEDALPAFTSETVDATNPARPTFAWTSASPSSTAAALIVEAYWSDPSDDAGDLRYGTWTLVVPPGQTSIVLPQIPSASGFGPAAGATWPGGNAIAAVNADAYPTYDSIRAAAADFGPLLFNLSTTTATLPPLPANGRARLTEYQPF